MWGLTLAIATACVELNLAPLNQSIKTFCETNDSFLFQKYHQTLSVLMVWSSSTWAWLATCLIDIVDFLPMCFARIPSSVICQIEFAIRTTCYCILMRMRLQGNWGKSSEGHRHSTTNYWWAAVSIIFIQIVVFTTAFSFMIMTILLCKKHVVQQTQQIFVKIFYCWVWHRLDHFHSAHATCFRTLIGSNWQAAIAMAMWDILTSMQRATISNYTFEGFLA